MFGLAKLEPGIAEDRSHHQVECFVAPSVFGELHEAILDRRFFALGIATPLIVEVERKANA